MHLKTLGIPEHNEGEMWKVDFHDEFFVEFGTWSEAVQDAVLSLLGISGLRWVGRPWTHLRGQPTPT
jgi:hypothetical protein